MPRNVRPAWLELDVDDRSPIATGPRRHDGYLEGYLYLRTAQGTISEAIRFQAGGSVPRMTINIPHGWGIEREDRPAFTQLDITQPE